MFFWRIYEYPLILVGFWKIKGLKSAILGSVACPRRDVVCSRRGVAEWEAGQALGRPQRRATLQRSIATVHNMEMFVVVSFCYSVIPRPCLLD